MKKILLLVAAFAVVSCGPSDKEIKSAADDFVTAKILPLFPGGQLVKTPTLMSVDGPVTKISDPLKKQSMLNFAEKTRLDWLDRIDVTDPALDIKEHFTVKDFCHEGYITALEKADAEEGFYEVEGEITNSKGGAVYYYIILSKDLDVLNPEVDTAEISDILSGWPNRN